MDSGVIFFFNDTATTEIYTLSLHDALPIFGGDDGPGHGLRLDHRAAEGLRVGGGVDHEVREQQRRGHVVGVARSEEHTSELQSRQYLVCRLLLEKKNLRQPAHPVTWQAAHM